MVPSSEMTWTVFLIVYIIPSFVAGLPLGGSTELQPKTLYEALVVQCPEINNTSIRKNLDDIFSSKCSNFTAIQVVKPVMQEKDYVACRVLYESLKSFCTTFGDHIAKYNTLMEAVTSSSHTLEDICLSNKSLSSNFSVLSHDKDVTNFVQSTLCILACADTKPVPADTKPVPTDTCQAAYFFATFDVPKLLSYSESLPKKSEVASAQSSKDVKDAETQQQVARAPELAHDNENKANLQPPTKLAGNNSKHVVGNEESDFIQGAQHPPPPEGFVENNEKNQHSSREGVDKIAGAPAVPVDQAKSKEIKAGNDGTKAEPPVKTPDVHQNRDENVAGAAQEEKPGAGKNESPDVDKKVVDADNNQDIDKSLEPNGDAREAYEGDIGEDETNEKPDDAFKVEPVVPNENDIKETPRKKQKPNTLEADEPVSSDNIPGDDMDGDSYFLSYFSLLTCLVVVGYVGYHNRQKVLALLLEGKRGKRNGRHSRRPNSANYHKLDSNLEEAMSSSCTKNATNVIY